MFLFGKVKIRRLDFENLSCHFFHMASANEDTRKFLLIASTKVLFLTRSCLFLEEVFRNNIHQLRFPFRQCERFDWKRYDELVCKAELRFEKGDIPRPLHRKGFAMTVHKSSAYAFVKLLGYNT